MQDSDKVYFSLAQLALLEEVFPQIAFGPNATEQQLRHYHGQQSVLDFIRRRTKGADKRIRNQAGDIPTPPRAATD
jgi:hypothetical protein